MPAIVNGSQYMQAVLYTGTGATLTISGLNFQPDFVWIKSRSAATDHKLTDSVRGVTKALVSNSTAAETTDSTGITTFNSDGFTLGASSTYNNSGATYVAWCWKAGGTAVTNTAGSISSQVSANTTSGFAVVTYTGTGANATVGHGLGVAPSMVICKSRGTAGTNWGVWHTSLTAYSYFVQLNTTAAQATAANAMQALPSSTVLSLGSSSIFNDAATMVAYCFAPIAGYSAFGSYTGNGSADGPFVYCGFRPRFLLVKRTDAASYPWVIFDTARSTYNVITSELYPNASSAEANSSNDFDIVSNGFKCRISAAAYNASSGTYIYAAFAENPFQNALAR